MTNTNTDDAPTASGSFTSDENGQAVFTFRKLSHHIHLSAISIANLCVTRACISSEHESTLAENNFNDRGDSGLDWRSTYTYTLYNGYRVDLSGWTQTRTYAKGFVTNTANTSPQAIVSGLESNTDYSYIIYQYASASGFADQNGFTAPGASEIMTNTNTDDTPTASGSFTSDENGQAVFTFRKLSNHIHLSAISIANLCVTRDDCNDWPYGTPGYCACHGHCSAWDWKCNRPVTDQFMLIVDGSGGTAERDWISHHTCNPGEWGCALCTATADSECNPERYNCASSSPSPSPTSSPTSSPSTSPTSSPSSSPSDCDPNEFMQLFIPVTQSGYESRGCTGLRNGDMPSTIWNYHSGADLESFCKQSCLEWDACESYGLKTQHSICHLYFSYDHWNRYPSTFVFGANGVWDVWTPKANNCEGAGIGSGAYFKNVCGSTDSSSSSSTGSPTSCPTISPTSEPTGHQSKSPSVAPTTSTSTPSQTPSSSPMTSDPTALPTTTRPTQIPSTSPVTSEPTAKPSIPPSLSPTVSPSSSPVTSDPTASPTTTRPTHFPSSSPVTSEPTVDPTLTPTAKPSVPPSVSPTNMPTSSPTSGPTTSPTSAPSEAPTTNQPSKTPSMSPTHKGFEGSLCNADDECDSLRCNVGEFPYRCREKKPHSEECQKHSDCKSDKCLDGKCVDGRENDLCNSNDDCDSGRCAFGVPFGKCQHQVEHGSSCIRDNDCASGHCLLFACTDHRDGAHCVNDDDCVQGSSCAWSANGGKCKKNNGCSFWNWSECSEQCTWFQKMTNTCY